MTCIEHYIKGGKPLSKRKFEPQIGCIQPVGDLYADSISRMVCITFVYVSGRRVAFSNTTLAATCRAHKARGMHLSRKAMAMDTFRPWGVGVVLKANQMCHG